MKVTAIIVNYFSSSFLPPLLEILNNDPLISEIIVADNSAEPVLSEVLRGFPKARSLPFSRNIGFAAAVNRTAKTSKSDWWLLINPDTIPGHDFVKKLLGGAEKTNALIAGPRFYWDDEKTFKLPPAIGHSWLIQAGLESANRSEMDARLVSFNWDIRFERFWNETEPFFEPFLSGACLLIRNDKFFFGDGKIFDERFFLYFEDTDLCTRAILNGQNIVCVPQAEVVHYWDQSPSEQKGQFMAESHQKFNEKHNLKTFKNLLDFENLSGFNVDNDYGETYNSPVFRFQKLSGTYFFELGLNHFFVPFARSEAKDQTFQFPEPVWQRLHPGQYFGRIRNSQNQTIATWKWKKL